MQIILSSNYDSEVLLEDDISPVVIHQELTDRILEIDVSIQDIADWLETEQSTLKVSESFGETISLIKEGFDTHSQVFVEYDSVYDTEDLFNQVIQYPDEIPEIDMDIGDYPYTDTNTRSVNPYEKLRRWVESHPIQWYKMTLPEIAEHLNISLYSVWTHLSDCVISAKYVKSLDEYNQKRRETRGYKQVKSKPNPTIAKIHQWLRHNYNQWQSMTFEEISEQTQTSSSAVYNHLPKLLLAEGFISNMSEYNQKRKAGRGYKDKKDKSVNYIVDII